MKNIINFDTFVNESAEISEHQLDLFRDANRHQVEDPAERKIREFERKIGEVKTFDDAIDLLTDLGMSDSYSLEEIMYAYQAMKRKFPELQLNDTTVRLADSGQEGLAAEKARKVVEVAKLMANKMKSSPMWQKISGR